MLLCLISLAILQSCRQAPPPYPPPADRAITGAVRLVSQSLEITGQTFLADYGTITVPEVRSKPGSSLLHLPFLRIHSSSNHPAEPVFGLAGGPGMSNIQWDLRKALPLLPSHDVVLVGYRGVDGSVRLECPEVSAAMTHASEILSQEALDAIGDAWQRAAQRLRSSGVDLDGYTISECIGDLESVRQALGYDRIDLLSESYGTRVALLYAQQSPRVIGRSAMIGVNPPGCFLWDPLTTDAILRRHAALWDGDSACAAQTPDLSGTLQRVLQTMPRRWLVFPIDPGRVRGVTFALLFERATAGMVFDAYVAADHGDPSGLALMSAAFNWTFPGMIVWGDLAAKAASADGDTARIVVDRIPPEAPLGAPLTTLLWAPLNRGRWPTASLPDTSRRVVPSDVETLLLSGSLDVSTPPQTARRDLLPFLRHGRQIVLAECGHVNDLWNANPENTRRILRGFFDSGTPDTSANVPLPMTYHVPLGFPGVAKLLLGGAVFVPLLCVGGVGWWVMRRRRKHRLAQAS